MDKIRKIMKEICDKQVGRRNYYAVLEKIYDHLSKHETEPPDERPESVRRIIDSEIKGESK